MADQGTVPERPDAAKFSFSWKPKGSNKLKRLQMLLDTADRLLAVVAARGEKSYIRKQVHGEFYFATRNPTDTLLFPVAHGLEGQSRYNWESQPDGSALGYLVAEAKDTGDSDAA